MNKVIILYYQMYKRLNEFLILKFFIRLLLINNLINILINLINK